MTKEQILQKHFTTEFGHDGHGKFMKYILDAMEEYAQQQVKNCNLHIVTCLFLSADEKVEQFKKELKALLVKFNAELIIEDFGRDWSSDKKIVVNFNWDEDLANRTENGIVPDWAIGSWENGR